MNPRDLLAKIGSVSVAAAALVVGNPATANVTPPSREAVIAPVPRPAATLAKLLLAPAGETNGTSARLAHRSHSSHRSHYSHRSSSSSSSRSTSGSTTEEPSPTVVPAEPVVSPKPPWTIHESGAMSPKQEELRVGTRNAADQAKFQQLLTLIEENDLGPLRHLVDKDKWLLKASDAKGRTALHYAAQQTRPEVVSLLLQRKAEVNVRSVEQSMPIDLVPVPTSTTDKGYRTLEVLLSSGAKANGGTKVPPAVRCLLSLSETDDQASTEDRSATQSAQPVKEAIASLVKHGADINAYDGQGNTLLLAAIQRNLPSLAVVLVNEGANFQASNDAGENALHLIARTKVASYEVLADLLLKKGVSINAEDKRGNTALDVAIKCDNSAFATYLRQHGGKE